ncbi:DNA adenine methylase [Bartonella taylorii]|uniref:site-specific DNA-methyltransferase (adenine-specific) n=1 Tax=Bartonella taylorii TaxID=33046 RepID=A0A9Q9DMB6_BARTA|nr:DNA adenine methylase [Bartonella taylorii]USP02726.1 DNA adenine methylase [Bartonella taylorii]USP03327.1 DNA adenine methylase [Bartonella taylorii]
MMTQEFTQTLFAWMGGKHYLRKKIIPILNNINHQTYVEPFLGSGVIFLNKRPAKYSIINDLNGEITNLFQCVQNNFDELAKQLEWFVCSRQLFFELAAIEPESLSKVERAARFLFLQRCVMYGKKDYVSFGFGRKKPIAFNPDKLLSRMRRVRQKLLDTTILNLSWERVVELFDAPDSLFYLDPPYLVKKKCYSSGNFVEDDFVNMAKVLKSIQGKFVLSLNDCDEVREIFRDFDFLELETLWTSGFAKKPSRKELLIRNN